MVYNLHLWVFPLHFSTLVFSRHACLGVLAWLCEPWQQRYSVLVNHCRKRWMPLSDCFCTPGSLSGTVTMPQGIHTSGSIPNLWCVCACVWRYIICPLNINDLGARVGDCLWLCFYAWHLLYSGGCIHVHTQNTKASKCAQQARWHIKMCTHTHTRADVKLK